MATVNEPVDVVIVGFGWTGAIMAIELAQTGLEVLALERGNDANTVPDWAYPKVVDEIAQSARHGLLQNLSKTTVTIRHSKDERAVPIAKSAPSSRVQASAAPAFTGPASIRG
jgi:gluconate 2-dehydrogenase alpha chain